MCQVEQACQFQQIYGEKVYKLRLLERAVISRIILKEVALVSLALFFVRLCYIDGIGKKGTSFLAIVGVLVHQIEDQIDKHIEQPTTFI